MTKVVHRKKQSEVQSGTNMSQPPTRRRIGTRTRENLTIGLSLGSAVAVFVNIAFNTLPADNPWRQSFQGFAVGLSSMAAAGAWRTVSEYVRRRMFSWRLKRIKRTIAQEMDDPRTDPIIREKLKERFSVVQIRAVDTELHHLN